MGQNIKPLRISEVFVNEHYVIPIYQRNYAWTELQIEPLVQDVANASKNNPQGNYYIGSLTVDELENGRYETIDGQQRLTTLYLLLCALGKKGCIDAKQYLPECTCLSFEYRGNSDNSLHRVWDGITQSLTDEEKKGDLYELHILDVFNAIVKSVERLCKDRGVSMQDFCTYLLSNVILLRIPVPKEIDKNHYFEVMNSRGVQLEQHEVIKSNLMGTLDTAADQRAFELIWNACSEMDRFVQMNFSPSQRKIVFGEEWTNPPQRDFDSLSESFISDKDNKEEMDQSSSLRNLIDLFNEGKPLGDADFKEDALPEERFHPIVFFPNFLLHVLKILRPKSEVPFYDKWLSETFENIVDNEPDKSAFTKEFASCLLQCRYLLDKYVIRRDREDRWGIFSMETSKSSGSLKSYPKLTFGEESDEGNELVLVQSMFHFAIPGMNYKNWLDGTLTYLYGAGEITAKDFLDHMKTLAKAYMTDWYFCKDPIPFQTIIHENGGVPQNDLDETEIPHNINQGTAVDSFIFNFYDYILWKEKGGEIDFHFTYRTSVEHFYPQHPTGGDSWEGKKELNSFGNLCLITTSMNSKFTNQLPSAKYAEYGSDEKARELSLKLQEMFDSVKKNLKEREKGEEWNTDDVRRAEDNAVRLFVKYLKDVDMD